jgi:hypothetical protein
MGVQEMLSTTSETKAPPAQAPASGRGDPPQVKRPPLLLPDSPLDVLAELIEPPLLDPVVPLETVLLAPLEVEPAPEKLLPLEPVPRTTDALL